MSQNTIKILINIRIFTCFNMAVFMLKEHVTSENKTLDGDYFVPESTPEKCKIFCFH